MRVVRDLTKFDGCGIVYTRSNGYFRPGEFDGPEWQFGRDYLEMQILHARLEKGEAVSADELKKVIEAYCGVLHRAAYLRGAYDAAMDVIEGRAEFRDE